MVRRAGILVALAAAAFAAYAAPAAAAPCDDNDVYELPPFFFPTGPPHGLPSEIAWERSVSAGEIRDFDLVNYTVVQGSINVSFSALVPSRPIREPWSGAYPAPPNSTAVGSGTVLRNIRFGPTDGPGVLRLSWSQYSPMQAGHECERTISQIINPIRGIAPAVGSPFIAGVELQELKIPLEVCGNGETPPEYSAVGRLRIRFAGGGGSRTITYADPCSTSPRTSKQGKPRWTLRPGKAVPVFAPSGTRAYRDRFRFSITFAGERLVSGRFRAGIIVRRGRTIQEGSDAFVNICINKGHPIISRGGRLQCTVAFQTSQVIEKLRLRR